MFKMREISEEERKKIKPKPAILNSSFVIQEKRNGSGKVTKRPPRDISKSFLSQ